jgi:hypothetical protein
MWTRRLTSSQGVQCRLPPPAGHGSRISIATSPRVLLFCEVPVSNEASQPSGADRRTCKLCGEEYSRSAGLGWQDAWRRHENESKHHLDVIKIGWSPPLPSVSCPECPRIIVAQWHKNQFHSNRKRWFLVCRCGHEMSPMTDAEVQRSTAPIPWRKLKEEYPDEFARQFGPD